MFKKILVTGGTGMMGKNLQKIIKNKQNYIFVGSRDADLTDINQTKKLFDKIRPDAVIHLAAIVGELSYNIENNVKMLDLNLRIELNLTKCCVEFNVKKVILTNSTCAFPAASLKYPMGEEDFHKGPIHHSNEGYGTYKRVSEILGRLYNESSNTKFITVYSCNIYGYFDINSCHVLSSLLKKAHEAKINNNNLEIWGTGKPVRQFIFAEDLAKLLLLILFEFNNESIIVSGNEEISIRDLASKISDIIGLKTQISNNLDKPDGLYKKTVSNNVLQFYFPTFKFTSLNEGIKKTYDWYTKNII